MKKENVLWYDSPADLKNWNEALPVGNGRLGAMVFFHRLMAPNTPPRKAPFPGPSSTEAIITGTWRMVALIMGRSMSPRGVKPMRSKMAVNRAVRTSP